MARSFVSNEYDVVIKMVTTKSSKLPSVSQLCRMAELFDVRFLLWGAAENQLDAELLLRIIITFLHPKEIRVG